MRREPPASWQARGHDAPLAQVLGATLEHLPALLARSPWLPIPQRRCGFGFGPEGRPLPVGAAARLWRSGLGGPCPGCDDHVLVFGGDGLLAVGGLHGVCPGCAQRCVWPLGGLGAVRRAFSKALGGTPFAIAGASLGGCVPGPRRPLWQALRGLGVAPLPPAAWALEQDARSISLTSGGRVFALQPDEVNGGRR